MNYDQELRERWAASFSGPAPEAALTGTAIDGHVASLAEYGIFPDHLPLGFSRRQLASAYTGVNSKQRQLLAKVEDAAAAWSRGLSSPRSSRTQHKQLRDRQVLAVAKAHRQGCSAWSISQAIRRGIDQQRRGRKKALERLVRASEGIPGGYPEREVRSAHE